MKITYDTTRASDEVAEMIAKIEDHTARVCWHLSGGVPVEHAPALEREAEAHEANAKAIRDEVAQRPHVKAARERQAKHAADWKAAFDEFATLEATTRLAMRRGASARLVSHGFSEVGSSDVNHELFALWSQNGRDWRMVILELVNSEELATR